MLLLNACVQALECWDPAIWSKALPVVEKGIVAAAQDAQAETRAFGRAAFAAYNAAAPDKARNLLSRMDGDTQARFNQAVAAYQRGALLEATYGAASPTGGAPAAVATMAPPAAAPKPRKSIGAGLLAPAARPATASATLEVDYAAAAPSVRLESAAVREGVARSRKSTAPERVPAGGSLITGDSAGEAQVRNDFSPRGFFQHVDPHTAAMHFSVRHGHLPSVLPSPPAPHLGYRAHILSAPGTFPGAPAAGRRPPGGQAARQHGARPRVTPPLQGRCARRPGRCAGNCIFPTVHRSCRLLAGHQPRFFRGTRRRRAGSGAGAAAAGPLAGPPHRGAEGMDRKGGLSAGYGSGCCLAQ